MKFWIILLIIFVVLVALDKGVTYVNVKQAMKNFPDAKEVKDYGVEKNPIARFFFQKFGLEGGTLIYGVLSILTLFLAFLLFRTFLTISAALWIIIIIYGLIIFNNLFFTLKFSGVIP